MKKHFVIYSAIAVVSLSAGIGTGYFVSTASHSEKPDTPIRPLDTLSQESAFAWVKNYGKWAGQISGLAIDKAALVDKNSYSPVHANQFISGWTIPQQDLVDLVANLPAQKPHSDTRVQLFLAISGADADSVKLKEPNPTAFELLKNIGKAMTKSHLILTLHSDDLAQTPRVYYDLIEPCPNMCYTTSALFMEYKEGFGNGFNAGYNKTLPSKSNK